MPTWMADSLGLGMLSASCVAMVGDALDGAGEARCETETDGGAASCWTGSGTGAASGTGDSTISESQSGTCSSGGGCYLALDWDLALDLALDGDL
jgi:hypothetical protein